MKYTHIPPWFAMAFFNFFTSSAHANCSYSGTPPSGSESHYIYRATQMEFTLRQNPNGLPLGSPVATMRLRMSLNATGQAAYQCSPIPRYIDRKLFAGFSPAPAPGLGILSVTIDGRTYPNTVSGMEALLRRPVYIDADIVFVRTGTIPTHTSFDGIFAQEFSLDTGQLLYEYRFNNFTTPPIVNPTCNLQPIPTVSLGAHPMSRFTGVNTVTSPQNFDINLSCQDGDQGSSISATMTFTDETNTANTSDVLSLDTSQSQVAGVGVQILWNNSPVRFGPSNAPSGSPNVYSLGAITQQGQGGAAFNYRIPLQARYKQTASNVTGGGKANARATVTINYQ